MYGSKGHRGAPRGRKGLLNRWLVILALLVALIYFASSLSSREAAVATRRSPVNKARNREDDVDVLDDTDDMDDLDDVPKPEFIQKEVIPDIHKDSGDDMNGEAINIHLISKDAPAAKLPADWKPETDSEDGEEEEEQVDKLAPLRGKMNAEEDTLADLREQPKEFLPQQLADPLKDSSTELVVKGHYVLYDSRDMKILRKISERMQELGYKNAFPWYDNIDQWDFLWSYVDPHGDDEDDRQSLTANKLRKGQLINRFPIGPFASKITLVSLDLPSIPLAFELPRHMKQFEKAFKNFPEKTWVRKNTDHRGVRVTSPREVQEFRESNDKEIFVQEFVSPPHLIHNRKWDIGVYVLVTSLNPLRIYVYDDLLLRFCPADYPADGKLDGDDIDTYVIGEDYTSPWQADFFQPYKEKHPFVADMLKSYFKEEEPNADFEAQFRKTCLRSIYDTISMYSTDMYASTKEYPDGQYQFFELFRFDYVFDHNVKAYLMEANMSPNISPSDHPGLNSLFTRLMRDLTSLVGMEKGPEVRASMIRDGKLAQFEMDNRGAFSPVTKDDVYIDAAEMPPLQPKIKIQYQYGENGEELSEEDSSDTDRPEEKDQKEDVDPKAKGDDQQETEEDEGEESRKGKQDDAAESSDSEVKKKENNEDIDEAGKVAARKLKKALADEKEEAEGLRRQVKSLMAKKTDRKRRLRKDRESPKKQDRRRKLSAKKRGRRRKLPSEKDRKRKLLPKKREQKKSDDESSPKLTQEVAEKSERLAKRLKPRRKLRLKRGTNRRKRTLKSRNVLKNRKSTQSKGKRIRRKRS